MDWIKKMQCVWNNPLPHLTQRSDSVLKRKENKIIMTMLHEITKLSYKNTDTKGRAQNGLSFFF